MIWFPALLLHLAWWKNKKRCHLNGCIDEQVNTNRAILEAWWCNHELLMPWCWCAEVRPSLDFFESHMSNQPEGYTFTTYTQWWWCNLQTNQECKRKSISPCTRCIEGEKMTATVWCMEGDWREAPNREHEYARWFGSGAHKNPGVTYKVLPTCKPVWHIWFYLLQLVNAHAYMHACRVQSGTHDDEMRSQ
jgi:hypothetical protein